MFCVFSIFPWSLLNCGVCSFFKKGFFFFDFLPLSYLSILIDRIVHKMAQQPKKRQKKADRGFDMSKYERRHIALKYCYMGQGYQGLALQEHSVATVEGVLFEALRKVRLIGPDEKVPLGYSRCGRTDKGVSSLGQVSAMMLRSNRTQAEPNKAEHDFCGILNRVLPEDVRVIGWSDVPEKFSARFSCSGRVYKYFFLKGKKDLEAMRAAAAKLVGEHDFRNFAKMDVVNVSNFVRTIHSMTVTPAAESLSNEVYVITVVGTAFLYHQVRCMVAVLFEIADGNETADVITSLLDTKTCPGRPIYNMASDLGLVLWDCLFPSIIWSVNHDAYTKLLRHFAAQYELNLITPMIQGHIHDHLRCNEPMRFLSVEGTIIGEETTYDTIPEGNTTEVIKKRATGGEYIPLMQRAREATYEEKISGLGGSKKRRHEENKEKGKKRKHDDGGEEEDLKEGDDEAEEGEEEFAPRAALLPQHIAKYA